LFPFYLLYHLADHVPYKDGDQVKGGYNGTDVNMGGQMSKGSVWWKPTFGIILGLAVILTGLYFSLDTERLDLDASQVVPGEKIELSNGIVHYRLMGPSDAPLVLLVHGFSVPSYEWEPTAEALEDAGYRVLSCDLYGRGYSARPAVEYDLDLFVSQLEELTTALELHDPIVVVGHSMGGPIAARFASLHPQHISGVVLIAPEVNLTTGKDVFPLNIPLVGEYLMTAVMEPIVLPKIQAADFVHPENYPEWESKYRVQLQYRGTGRALLSTIRNLTTFDPADEYRRLQEADLPVLLIWGREDGTIGPDQIALLQSLIPEIRTFIVEDAGHLPQFEQAEDVNEKLLQFLDKLFSNSGSP
jgi:pimeloyl-ACP methyl ester carboxylesterase